MNRQRRAPRPPHLVLNVAATFPMHSAHIDPATDGDLMSKFWTSPVSTAAADSFAARNLYELFVHDLGGLISGACQANHAAHSLYDRLPADQIGLRRLTLGLAKSTRACLPRLPVALIDEGLVLPATQNATVRALLSTIQPRAGVNDDLESWSVVGTRLVGVIHKVALHLEAQSVDAAENARLLGSDPLCETLSDWAAVWTDYIVELRSREPAFRAQAYAAGLINRPCWQTA